MKRRKDLLVAEPENSSIDFNPPEERPQFEHHGKSASTVKAKVCEQKSVSAELHSEKMIRIKVNGAANRIIHVVHLRGTLDHLQLLAASTALPHPLSRR